jgi:hypothetical protein
LSDEDISNKIAVYAAKSLVTSILGLNGCYDFAVLSNSFLSLVSNPSSFPSFYPATSIITLGLHSSVSASVSNSYAFYSFSPTC